MLFQILLRFPQLCVQVRTVLHSALLSGPRFVPVVVHLLEEYSHRGRALTLRALSPSLGKATAAAATATATNHSVVDAVDDAIERVSCYLLASFTDMLSLVYPKRRLLRYFPLMERMLMEPHISPLPTLEALSDYLNMNGSLSRRDGRGGGIEQEEDRTGSRVCTEGDWLVGRQILSLCRAALMIHPTSLVYGSLLNILRFVVAYYCEIDTRDQAWLMLQMLTHLNRDKIQDIMLNKTTTRLGEHGEDDATSSFRPQRFEGIQKTNPAYFLSLERTLISREMVGLMDLGSADIMVNEPEEAREQVYYKDAGRDGGAGDGGGGEDDVAERMKLLYHYGCHLMKSKRKKKSAAKKNHQKMSGKGEVENEEEEKEEKDTIPTSIHLPLRLKFQNNDETIKTMMKHGREENQTEDNETKKKDDLSVPPERLYSIVLEFSPSPNCIPLDTITLPFLTCSDSAKRSKSSANRNSHQTLVPSKEDRFPYTYDLLLSVHMTNPVPTSFQVRMVYNDDHGRTCEGPLPHIDMLFEDLFLRLPVAQVFRQYYKGTDKQTNGWIARELFAALWESVMVPSLGYYLMNSNNVDQGMYNSMEKLGSTWVEEEEEQELKGGQDIEESAGPAESVKILNMPRKNVIQAVLRHLGPFLVATKNSDRFDSQATQDQEEEWYVLKEDLASSLVAQTSSSDDLVDVRNAVIFLPPRYHLLLKFHISNTSTVVRLRTDRWQLLAEMDRYLDRWMEIDGAV